MTGIEKVEADKYSQMRRVVSYWMLKHSSELFVRTSGLPLTNPWNEETIALLAMFGMYLVEREASHE